MNRFAAAALAATIAASASAETAGITEPGSATYPYGSAGPVVMVPSAGENADSYFLFLAESGGAFLSHVQLDEGDLGYRVLRFDPAAPFAEGTLADGSTNRSISAAAVDRAHDRLYVASNGPCGPSPCNGGVLARLREAEDGRLASDGASSADALQFAATALAIDSASHHAFVFGAGRVAKVDVGAPGSEFGDVTVTTGIGTVDRAFADPSTGRVFAVNGSNVQVLDGGGASGSVTSVGSFSAASGTVIDAHIDEEAGYFWLLGATSLAKYDLETTGVPTLVGTLAVPSSTGEALAARAGSTEAWLATSGGIVPLDLGAGNATPSLPGGTVVGAGTGTPRLYPQLELDRAGRYLIGSNGFQLVDLEQGHAGRMRFSPIAIAPGGSVQEVRFYSHAAGGNLRFAIYTRGDSPALLWQSPSVANTAGNAEIVVPIGAGAPTSLTLMPGEYWLGWHSDSAEFVGSRTDLGETMAGLSIAAPFGTFPQSLDPDATNAFRTNEAWTHSITYTPAIPTPTPSPSPTPLPEPIDALLAMLGLTGKQSGEANGDGVVDAADYVWARGAV